MTIPMIWVQARAGIKVPREDNARKYVTDAAAVEVPDSIYYRRRLADGDLVAVSPAPVAVDEVPALPRETTAATADKPAAKKGEK